jgi:hypothetical protein
VQQVPLVFRDDPRAHRGSGSSTVAIEAYTSTIKGQRNGRLDAGASSGAVWVVHVMVLRASAYASSHDRSPDKGVTSKSEGAVMPPPPALAPR